MALDRDYTGGSNCGTEGRVNESLQDIDYADDIVLVKNKAKHIQQQLDSLASIAPKMDLRSS